MQSQTVPLRQSIGSQVVCCGGHTFSLFLAVEVVREKGFHLDVEDYLAGVLIMASELVRMN